METLCRLAGIKVSRDIATAAVEVAFRPHLLVNPDFVAQYCPRDEHLFLLVMHELWHILLAHTRLYPRATLAHNIAFDAVINAALAHQFHAPEYRGFFEALNKADEFPGCLLRAPEGWPADPVYLDVGPEGTRAIVARLYPPNARSRWSTPLYEEILNLLRQWIKDKIANGELIVEPFLIGDHSGGDSDAADDPVMRDVMRRVTESWPASLLGVGPGGRGLRAVEVHSDIGATSEAARRKFAQVLKICIGSERGKRVRRTRVPLVGMSGLHVIPNPRDRLASARAQLGVQGVLWSQPGIVMARLPETQSRVHIYIDVSGSMNAVLPRLLGLILPYVARGDALVYQFSTQVEPLPLAELKRGHLRTTQGTNINTVLPHLLNARPTVRRVLILTDGRTGMPNPAYVRQVKERNIRIHVVMPAESAYSADLQSIARSIIVLPSMTPHTGKF